MTDSARAFALSFAPVQALENPREPPHLATMRSTRTFDKLIATIRTRRSAGSLRSPFGAVLAITGLQVSG